MAHSHVTLAAHSGTYTARPTLQPAVLGRDDAQPRYRGSGFPVRLGGDGLGRPPPSQELLHKGLANLKQGGSGPLRLAVLLTSAENLLSKSKRIGVDANEHSASRRTYN
jgi:hypothetical protein